MTLKSKILFSLVSASFGGTGLLAIFAKTHSGYGRFVGQTTLMGSDAVSMGVTMVVMAALLLIVWLPRKIIGIAVSGWFMALMICIFGSLYLK